LPELNEKQMKELMEEKAASKPVKEESNDKKEEDGTNN
tara:strand:+ start:513 stop:626 length:114 start_codon:yes stop_codon:yes gene_type:complete